MYDALTSRYTFACPSLGESRVALSAFRESVRQPMFWLMVLPAPIVMLIIAVLPYFTLGEDIKMVKEMGYDLLTLLGGVFVG